MNIAQALVIRGEADSYERQENAWLLEHILQLGSLELKLGAERELSAEQTQRYMQGLARIAAGEPLAYVIGSQPFWSLDLNVTADTLVPRPDTEILIETVLQLDLPETTRLVDLGTGTGAIALALASERPQWQVLATDIYPATLAVAQANAIKHDLNHVTFLCGAWYVAFTGHAIEKFDLVVSNPPYIDALDEHMLALGAEPERALVAADQGLADIAHIIQFANQWLKPKAWLVLEHGFQQADAVQALFKQAGFSQIRTVKDYAGNDRVSLGQYP